MNITWPRQFWNAELASRTEFTREHLGQVPQGPPAQGGPPQEIFFFLKTQKKLTNWIRGKNGKKMSHRAPTLPTQIKWSGLLRAPSPVASTEQRGHPPPPPRLWQKTSFSPRLLKISFSPRLLKINYLGSFSERIFLRGANFLTPPKPGAPRN